MKKLSPRWARRALSDAALLQITCHLVRTAALASWTISRPGRAKFLLAEIAFFAATRASGDARRHTGLKELACRHDASELSPADGYWHAVAVLGCRRAKQDALEHFDADLPA